MSGFIKKIWKDRVTEFPTRRSLTKQDGSVELVTVAREEGTVSQEGDAFSAQNMNDLEERVKTAFDAVDSSLNNLIKTTDVTLTFTSGKSEQLLNDWANRTILSAELYGNGLLIQPIISSGEKIGYGFIALVSTNEVATSFNGSKTLHVTYI